MSKFLSYSSVLAVFVLVIIWPRAIPTVFAASVSAVEWGYDTVYEAHERPTWLNSVYLFEPAYQPAYEGQDEKRLRPWARRLQESGVTLVAAYPDGFCRLYDGGGWSEACRNEVKVMHGLGVKVVAGCYPFVGERGPRDILMAHPEWRKRFEDATPEGPGLGCMLHPGFSKALRELLVSRIQEYDIDGFHFDGWYQREHCRCPGCKKLYRSQTGRDVPPKVDPESVAYLKYMTWRDGVLLERLLELRKAVKAVKPEMALINWNNNDCAGATPSSMPEALNCIADWTTKEWWDGFDVYSVWLNKRLRGASGDERPPGMQPYMFMRGLKDIESGVYHGSSTPMVEVLYRMQEAMAMGSIPIIWSGMRAAWKDEDWPIVHQALHDFLPTIHGTKSLKYAVCIDSYTTLQNARLRSADTPHRGEDNATDLLVGHHRSGIARALLEEQIPFDVVSEHNVTLERLSEYRVVVLPNNFCMSERIAEVLRRYVQQGGGLVATHETSLFDRWGKRREDFVLADLFGAHYLETVAVGPSQFSFSGESHEVTDARALRDLVGNRPTTYWGKFVRVRTAKGPKAPVVPLRGLDVKRKDDDAAKHWSPLLLSEKGKGKVAYFSAAIDAAYFDAGYPFERVLIADAVRWAAGSDPEIRVSAPRCVFAGFFGKREGDRLYRIVHLLNTTNTTTGHGSRNEKEVAMREEILPIAGVKVRFVGERPLRVSLVPGGTPLTPRESKGGWEVTVPQMGIHAVVSAEYPLSRSPK